MEPKPGIKVYFFWSDLEGARRELLAETGDVGLTDLVILQMNQKIQLYSQGLAKQRRDWKPLRLFPDLDLIELRVDHASGGLVKRVRLIAARTPNCELHLLVWHLKNTASSSFEQRRAQNKAIQLARSRWEKRYEASADK